MKIQIRSGVFETNSSSTHSLTVMREDIYQDWVEGKVKCQFFYDYSDGGYRKIRILSTEEADKWNADHGIEELKDDLGQIIDIDELVYGDYYVSFSEYDSYLKESEYEYENKMYNPYNEPGKEVRILCYWGYDG